MWQGPSVKMRIKQRNELRRLIETARAKQGYMTAKLAADISMGMALAMLTLPAWCLIALLIRAEDGGSVVYAQKRIGQFGKPFYIYKFRTMRGTGSPLTLKDDDRITKVGRVLRKYRLDELPQIMNLIKGEMSLVGSRPEHPSFVSREDKLLLATLLMPVGITSEASIRFRNESELLAVEEPERFYRELILPIKTRLNLEYIKESGLGKDLMIIVETLHCIVGQSVGEQ